MYQALLTSDVASFSLSNGHSTSRPLPCRLERQFCLKKFKQQIDDSRTLLLGRNKSCRKSVRMESGLDLSQPTDKWDIRSLSQVNLQTIHRSRQIRLPLLLPFGSANPEVKWRNETRIINRVPDNTKISCMNRVQEYNVGT